MSRMTEIDGRQSEAKVTLYHRRSRKAFREAIENIISEVKKNGG